MKIFQLLLTIFFSTIAIAGTYSKTEKMELAAKDVELIDIDCGAGFLKVRGVENSDKIEVTAEIEVQGISGDELEEFIKRHVTLTLEKSSKKAVLKSRVENGSSYYTNAHIDLTVKVPKQIKLNVNDGSGSIEVTGLSGNLDINDGSGSIEINEIAGNIRIDDGSGSINVRNVEGDISIDDGSGSMEIVRVSGEVTVSDGSGSIYINDVSKDVNIIESGSGGLTVRNVQGAVNKRK